MDNSDFSLKTRHKKKIWFAGLCIMLIFIVLAAQMSYIMVFCSEYYLARADDLHERHQEDGFLMRTGLFLLQIKQYVLFPLSTARLRSLKRS